VDLKFDWYQNANTAYVSYKANSPESASQVEVVFSEHSYELKLDGKSLAVVELINPIIPDQSSKSAVVKKLEIKLAKKDVGANWMGLEKGGKQSLMAASASVPQTSGPPSYPSSKRKDFNYDKLDKQMQKELDAEKPEGEGALNSMFQQIYANSTEETRRAMIKSYQTSGGTVLSTNWDEV
jgi:suppressor of G2 allele of SKP1